MSKILLFSAWQLSKPPHFETDLELLQQHIDKGDEVSFIGCEAELLSCDMNIYHDFARCIYCVKRKAKGLDCLTSEIDILPLINLNEADFYNINNINRSSSDLKDFQTMKFEGFDIGWAVLSTLISRLQNPEPDLIEYNSLVNNLLKSSLAVYLSMKNHLNENHFDRVYVFNNRFAINRAVFRACREMGVKTFCHDRGHNPYYYNIFEDVLIHNINYYHKGIIEHWDSRTETNKEEIGSQYYLDLMAGNSPTGLSYTDEQDTDLLPADWNENLQNIAIFISSEDEFAAVGDEWVNPIYEGQMEGINSIISSLKDRENYHVYIRVHPRLKDFENVQKKHIEELRSPNLTVIPPDSPVSTYALMRKASKIITFGSTVGIEAVFWGTPSILAGVSLYRDLNGTYNPASHEELMELVLDTTLTPKSKEAAIIYGFYRKTFGKPYKYYQAEGRDKGRFRNRRVTPDFFSWIKIAVLILLSPLRRYLSKKSLERSPISTLSP